MMILSDSPPKNLSWLTEGQDLLKYDESFRQQKRILEAEAVLVVDTNAKQRIGDLSRAISKSSSPTYLIDHHPNPEKWLKNRYVDTTASSTGEMIHRIISTDVEPYMNELMGQALYAAIMTDTGSFRFNSVTPAVHRAVADILEKTGLNPEPMHNKIFKSRTPGVIRLFGMVMQSLEMAYENRLAIIQVTLDMLHSTETRTDQIEGFVEHLLSIDTAKAAIIFTEMPNHVKISFRSEEKTIVNEWAAAFGGGGHKNASGAFIKGELHEVKERVIAACPEYVEFI